MTFNKLSKYSFPLGGNSDLGIAPKRGTVLLFFALVLSACSPRVEIAPPEKPIEINLNVKIEHEVRINVQKDLEKEIFSDESGLF